MEFIKILKLNMHKISFKGDWNQTLKDVENFKVWNKPKDYVSSAQRMNSDKVK